MMEKTLIKSIQERIAHIRPWTSPLWHQRYVLFSAHLGLAFPQVTPQKHLEWFHRLLLNQQLMLAEEDGSYLHEIQWEGPLDELLTVLNTRPSIICTFHTGSYRLLNHFLLQHCTLPHSLLVSKEVDESERPDFGHKLQEMNLPARSAPQTIVADHPQSALKIMRSLPAGRHLLAYLDGNIGAAHGPLARDTRLELRFLGLPIRVRVGLAYLAHRAGVPLICIIAHRISDQTNCMRIVRIIPDPKLLHSDPTDFARHATADMYRNLEKLLVNEPWQWDMWFHFRENLI
ncbi:MAG: hypothetical protein WCY93_09645 [Anaerolineaceae bacterium]